MLANKVTLEHTKFNINDINYRIRKYTSIKHVKKTDPFERISTYCMPHTILANHLKTFNIELTSPVTHLKAGIQNQGLPHVFSFHRNVFANITDDRIRSIPDSIIIE